VFFAENMNFFHLYLSAYGHYSRCFKNCNPFLQVFLFFLQNFLIFTLQTSKIHSIRKSCAYNPSFSRSLPYYFHKKEN